MKGVMHDGQRGIAMHTDSRQLHTVSGALSAAGSILACEASFLHNPSTRLMKTGFGGPAVIVFARARACVCVCVQHQVRFYRWVTASTGSGFRSPVPITHKVTIPHLHLQPLGALLRHVACFGRAGQPFSRVGRTAIQSCWLLLQHCLCSGALWRGQRGEVGVNGSGEAGA